MGQETRDEFEAWAVKNYAIFGTHHEADVAYVAWEAAWKAATEQERERCAKVCEGISESIWKDDQVHEQLERCATVIRGGT